MLAVPDSMPSEPPNEVVKDIALRGWNQRHTILEGDRDTHGVLLTPVDPPAPT